VAIETALFIRQVFHLALRQTEGFTNSLARALKVEICIPDFSCISKRSIGLPRHVLSKFLDPGSFIIVDSTGLKVYGKDEWHQEKHTVAARRTWRKLHLAIDEHHQVLACELTTKCYVTIQPLRGECDRIPAKCPAQDIEHAVVLDRHVDFGALAAEVDRAAPRPDRSRGGRPPFPTESKSYFGYKLSANADKRYKLIRKLKVSTASEHDTNHFEDVLDTANTSRTVLADKGYVDGEREARLTDAGWRMFIQCKGGKDKPLSETQERRNRRIAKTRARVEHVFAGLAQLGGKALRST